MSGFRTDVGADIRCCGAYGTEDLRGGERDRGEMDACGGTGGGGISLGECGRFGRSCFVVGGDADGRDAVEPDVGGREGPEGEGELTGNGRGLGVSGGTEEYIFDV